MASTNFIALMPIVYAYNHSLNFVCFSITFAMISSFLYHLVEHNKHYLPGVSSLLKPSDLKYFLGSNTLEFTLLQLDRFGVFLSIVSIINTIPFQVLIQRILSMWGLIICALGFMLISEALHYYRRYLSNFHYTKHPNQRKYIFLVLHSIWHIFAFFILYNLIIN